MTFAGSKIEVNRSLCLLAKYCFGTVCVSTVHNVCVIAHVLSQNIQRHCICIYEVQCAYTVL